MPGIEATSEAIWELVPEGASVTRLATGFGFTEGPVWHPREHHLLFSDLGADARRRYTPDGAVVDARRPANKGNGMTYDADLALVVCEHVTSAVAQEHADGSRETLASHFEGRELNSPNDVVVRSDGSIYFTDPWYGRMAQHGLERPRELGFQGVYRIPPGGGELELLVDRDAYGQPNGLCFSPDESLLYVDDTTAACIDVYDVAADGCLANRRCFADGIGGAAPGEGVVDGMKCDERGDVWVTGPDGIWVFDPAGRRLGVVEVPEITANLAWGGEDWRTLFVTATTSLYAIRTLVGPRREPFMR